MKCGWIVIALAVWAVTSADSAAARPRHRAPHYAARQCVDRPLQFSWDFLFSGAQPGPRPNGCSPPVFTNGRFLGQDPDPAVRRQLLRDPDTGYAPL
jgi:hypothetical protein